MGETRDARPSTLYRTVLPLLVWFLAAARADVPRLGSGAVNLHSMLGLAFVTISLAWTSDQAIRDLASPPGPQFRGWARRLPPSLRPTLVWELSGMALTGFMLGLTSPCLPLAGPVLPIGPPVDPPRPDALVGRGQGIEFHTLAGVVHASYHHRRHPVLRGKAVRIMPARRPHRFS
jgi:cytochrome b561